MQVACYMLHVARLAPLGVRGEGWMLHVTCCWLLVACYLHYAIGKLKQADC